jgi:hypothetical protein
MQYSTYFVSIALFYYSHIEILEIQYDLLGVILRKTIR